jgi:hypothetical protein
MGTPLCGLCARDYVGIYLILSTIIIRPWA